MEIEFHDPKDATLYNLGKKSVVITSFVKKDRWKELKSKFKRVIPIFVRSEKDEQNLKELIEDFDHMMSESIKRTKELSDAIESLNEKMRSVKEDVATSATTEIINSLVIDYPVEGSVCFNVDIWADSDKVIESLKKFCDKHDCYVLHVEDYSDWDYGGKRQIIVNPDEFVKDVDPHDILGRVFYRFCVLNKKKFRKLVEETKKRVEEAKKRAVIYGEALKELRNAVKVEKWFDEERGEDVYEFRWDENLVREIARKYGLSDEDIQELKDKVEDEIMFKEPAIYF